MPQVSATIDKFLTSQTLNSGEKAIILTAIGGVPVADVSTTGGVSKIPKTDANGKLALIDGANAGIETINGRFSDLEVGGILSADTDFVLMYNTSGTMIFSTEESLIWDNGNSVSIDWSNRKLLSTSGTSVFDWSTMVLADYSETPSVFWDTRSLGRSTVLFQTEALNWENSFLFDWNAVGSLDWNNRIMLDYSEAPAVDWTSASNVKAPGQTDTPSDPDTLLIMQAGNYLYGRRYYIGGLNQISSSTSASYTNVASVILPAGSYAYKGTLIGTTASSTAGVLVEVSGTALEVFGVALRGTAATEGAAGVAPTIYCKSTGSVFSDVAVATVAAGDGKYAFADISGIIRLTSSTTFTLRVKQLTTDAGNPTYCSKGSYVEFRAL